MALEYTQIAQSGPKSIIHNIEGLSSKYNKRRIYKQTFFHISDNFPHDPFWMTRLCMNVMAFQIIREPFMEAIIRPLVDILTIDINGMFTMIVVFLVAMKIMLLLQRPT